MKRRTFVGAGSMAWIAPAVGAQPAPIDAVAAYEAASGGRIGLYAENVRTGARLAWRADERVVMCSTFKASLAACVLWRVDRGQDDLAQTIRYGAADMQDWHAPVAQARLASGARSAAGLSVGEMSIGEMSVAEMCQAAVEQSDNTCANLLLARIGGPAALTAFWRDIGDRVTRLDDPEPLLNRTPPGGERNTTTPAAMAASLRRLVIDANVLSAAGRAALTGWLIGCQTGARRLRAGLPGGWVIGDKTGNNGADASGDIAVMWPAADLPIVVCVYTRGGSPTPRHTEDAFAGIGRAVAARLA